MAKNILVLAASPRKDGNSDILCDQFIKGASGNGNKIEKIYVNDLNIGPCQACLLYGKRAGCLFHKGRYGRGA
jgi:multimeric flavodoxin WrbA